MYDAQQSGGKLLSSVERTCERLDLGKTTVYELIKSKKLEAVKVGVKTLITETSIQALLSQLVSAAHREVA